MFLKKADSFKKKTFLICFLIIFSLVYNCEKEQITDPVKEHSDPPKPPDPENPEELEIPLVPADTTVTEDSVSVLLSHSDSVAIAKLPQYYNFLVELKESGYIFLDFRTFIRTDTVLLPEKLLVIRHDVHYRDIKWAYYAFQVERIVIGAGRSTFYIMLNDPWESSGIQNQYMDLIHYLDSHHVDIQPHVSPVDLYIVNSHPVWESYTLDTLRALFDRNYYWEVTNEGRQIVITGEDVFDISHINNELISLLPAYNQEWTKQTNLEVQGYAAHGSGTTMNKVINNAYLLDQYILLNEGIYEYDTYNSKIFQILTYLSDNYLPPWMTDPGSLKTGRYQFLMHPYQWIR